VFSVVSGVNIKPAPDFAALHPGYGLWFPV
jgi:hypothetical protein